MAIFVIVGAFIGAGFASGKEIYLFFYRYGVTGLLGLIICSAFFSYLIYKVFKIIINYNIENYTDFLQIIFNGNKKIIKAMNTIINLFLLVTFFIMVAGFGSYFKQEFYINKILGSALLGAICFIMFMTNIKGIVKVSSFIVPFLIFCILIISFYNFTNLDLNTIQTNLNKNFNTLYSAILSGLLYCSYNMILIIPVIVNLKKYIKNQKQMLMVSILTGFIIFILSICIFFLLSNIAEDLSLIEMPAVYAISTKYSQFKGIYGIIILLSIFTTAISIGIAFLENAIQKGFFPQFAGIMCITGIFISNFGFSNLVNFLFPLFGLLGLIEIICILKKKCIL